MADKLDCEGKEEQAARIDQVLQSMAGPRAPLKGFDDDVKKNLVIFIAKADKNLKDSIEGIVEMLRRLRYFDADNYAKEIGLDRSLKDMKKTYSGVSEVLKKFYELTHGKHPTKQDLEDLLEEQKDKTEQNALDFFEEQRAKDRGQKECDNPGEKTRSQGKGKGLARGKGEGPIGEPKDFDVDLELEIDLDDEDDLEDLDKLLEEFWDDDEEEKGDGEEK